MKDDQLIITLDSPGSSSYIFDGPLTGSTSDEDEDVAFYELYLYRDSPSPALSCLDSIPPVYFDGHDVTNVCPVIAPDACRAVAGPVTEKGLTVRPDTCGDSVCLACRISFNKKPSRCPNCGKPVIVNERN